MNFDFQSRGEFDFFEPMMLSKDGNWTTFQRFPVNTFKTGFGIE